MKKTAISLLFLSYACFAFSQLNMQLLDQIDYTPNANDVWGWVDPDNDKEYALVGLVTGVSIVDVSDPSNVVEVQFIPGPSSSWRDIKTWGNYAYVTNESSGGVLVINLGGAPNNITWTSWTPNIPGLGTLNKCHNLYIDEFGYCYLAGCNLNSGGMLFVDVFSTPGNPIYVGKAPAVYSHDVYARDNKMYASEIYGGKLSIYDVTDKQNTVLLASQQTPHNFTHNAWLNDAGDVVFTTDEKANAFVAAYDISDLGDIQELDRYRPLETLGAGVIPHNVHVWNDWLIISYYTDGGIIVDASRPENLIEVGNWDTFLGGSGFSGVWGAYPFLPSGIVLLTDIGTGLYVCGANYVRACWLEGNVTNAVTGAPVNGASISIDSPQANGATTDATGDYETGQAISGVFDVTFSATGYFSKTVQATLENGEVTMLDVQLEPLTIPNFPQVTASVQTGCEPLTVSFGENSGLAAAWSWTFENGTPPTSSEQFPNIIFETPGPHSVTLEVVTIGGNSYSVQLPDMIMVEPAPVASFGASVDSLSAIFTNTSSFYNTVDWDFGDGSISTDPNPTHYYAAPGTYDVVLTASGDCGTDVFMQQVVIGPFQPTAIFSANVVEGCAPLTVQFTDMSTGFPDTWEWLFPGGNPATSNEQHPVVTYNGSGAFDVQLKVTTGAGSNQLVQTGLITVNDVPATSFTHVVNGPESVFTNTSMNAETFSWDFGDGTFSTEENPVHLYQSAGTYTVELTAGNDCGEAVYSQTITITASQPTADFIANVQEGCSPLMVQFTDASMGQPDNWLWSFPGGSPSSSTDQHPVVTYSAPGIYDVTLVVSNALGNNENTQVGYIVVDDIPTAGFTYSNVGPEVTFTNASTNAAGYLWEFHDGTGAWTLQENPVYTFPGLGSYEVVLYAINDCGTAIQTSIVNINAVQPVAGFGISGSSGCAPFSVAFSDQSQNSPTAWQWTFPGGEPATSNEQNPVVVYHNPGVYSATLLVSNSGGNSETTQTDIIVVNDLPDAEFTYTVNGMEVTFINTSLNGASYFWSFGNGSISTEEQPSTTYSGPGTYPVTLAVTNDCGTSFHTGEVIIPAEVPVAGFTSSQSLGCVPLEIQFTDESTNLPTSWAWSFPGGDPATSTAQHPVVVYNSSGVYSVELTVTNMAGSHTTVQSDLIIVEDVPTVGFTFSVNDQEVTFTNASVDATAFSWDFGDGSGGSTEEDPVHTFSEPGEYEVTMTAENGCGTNVITQTIVIEPNAAINLDEKNYSIVASPNPFSEAISIRYELQENLTGASISVFNILGEEILEKPVNAGAGTLQLAGTNLPGGIYFIQLKVGHRMGKPIRIVKI